MAALGLAFAPVELSASLWSSVWWAKKFNHAMEFERCQVQAVAGDVTFKQGSSLKLNADAYNGGKSLIMAGKLNFHYANVKDVQNHPDKNSKEVTITTGNDGLVILFLYNDTAGNQTSQTFLKIEANSELKITGETKKDYANFKFVKGTISEDKNLKKLEKYNDFMDFICESVWFDFVDKEVEFWRNKTKKDNAALAKQLIEWKSKKSSGLAGLMSFAPPILMPAEIVHVYAQWVLQAEMAYTLARVYGKKNYGGAEFRNHFILLMAEPGFINEALTALGDSATGFVKDKVSEKLTAHYITTTPAFQKIMQSLTAKLGERLGKQTAGKAVTAAGNAVVPIAGAFVAAYSQEKEIKAFAARANKFYAPVTIPAVPKGVRVTGTMQASTLEVT